MSQIQLWTKTLDLLEKDLNKQHFETWIKPIQCKEILKDKIILSVTNKFIKDWIFKNFKEKIEQKLHEITGIEYKV
ncbi:MAG: chromosomal replication initiator protein DnaA, partial [Candidatus Marinimicrobia bacterium]|nr:chromosomal replication initiator protein DnaA [Candidatus Neomarinimicrobiota bacterium]